MVSKSKATKSSTPKFLSEANLDILSLFFQRRSFPLNHFSFLRGFTFLIFLDRIRKQWRTRIQIDAKFRSVHIHECEMTNGDKVIWFKSWRIFELPFPSDLLRFLIFLALKPRWPFWIFTVMLSSTFRMRIPVGRPTIHDYKMPSILKWTYMFKLGILNCHILHIFIWKFSKKSGYFFLFRKFSKKIRSLKLLIFFRKFPKYKKVTWFFENFQIKNVQNMTIKDS